MYRFAMLRVCLRFSMLLWIGDYTSRVAVADITLVAHERLIEVVAGANVNSSAPPAEEFDLSSSASGSFNASRQAEVVASGMGDFAAGEAFAVQRSLLQRSSVEAEGETHVAVNVVTASGGGAFGDAVTDFFYEFTLDAPTGYEVIAVVDHFGPVSDARVQLVMDGSSTVFAIGEPTGYALTSISQSGTLAPGDYELIAGADTVLTWLGPSFPDTSGAEFGILLSLDVVAPGDIVNGGLLGDPSLSSDIFGWGHAGSVTLVEDGEETMVQLETGPAASLSQSIDTLSSSFLLSFDYLFLDAEGTLQVLLNGQTLLTLVAPPTVEAEPQRATVLVDEMTLLGMIDVPLELMFDGPVAGLRVLVDTFSIRAYIAGDFDLDGDVDGRDFLVWQRNPSVGELADWQANYGGGALVATAVVPELSAFVFAIIGSMAALLRRRPGCYCFYF